MSIIKPYPFFMRKLDSCWHELSKTGLEFYRWRVSSRHRECHLPIPTHVHLSPSSLQFWSQASGEGDQDAARRIWSPKAEDLGVLPCGFWSLARRSKGKEGQNNRTEISVSVHSSFLYFVKVFSLEWLLKLHLLAKRKNEFHSIFQQPCLS